ncbi:receptor activity-modifying protein 1 isoform X1 [Sinocyclocheilus grahami]|uniref:Receptor activity-modifying protein 1-like n=2 Tax=Sinocyclocheilus grahami TaxID=75366 RepID=A0A672KZ62_SINGR|nr:PREDICTED: receptor activity-modifying protein 1-like isoform X1 [Sinocyclocheilus grahami]
MLYLSGLLLLLLDLSMICGQMTQDNRTAFEDERIRVKNESVQQELDKSFSTERPNVTYEDKENFQTSQDFQISYSHCHEEMLKNYGGQCWEIFNDSMSELGKENWCNMEMVIRNYHKLTECIEFICSALGCFYPNRVVEQLFVRIHQQYFSSCNNEEDLPDAPAGVVLVSTLLPILLIPFIVFIVVWKSSLRD